MEDFNGLVEFWVQNKDMGINLKEWLSSLRDSVQVKDFRPAKVAKEIYEKLGKVYTKGLFSLINIWSSIAYNEYGFSVDSEVVKAKLGELWQINPIIPSGRHIPDSAIEVVRSMYQEEVNAISATFFALFEVICSKGAYSNNVYARVEEKLSSTYGFDWYIV